jgi:hypothetical protein
MSVIYNGLLKVIILSFFFISKEIILNQVCAIKLSENSCHALSVKSENDFMYIYITPYSHTTCTFMQGLNFTSFNSSRYGICLPFQVLPFSFHFLHLSLPLPHQVLLFQSPETAPPAGLLGLALHRGDLSTLLSKPKCLLC